MSLAAATPLVLAGSGKMGGAMLAGWLDMGLDPAGVTVIDPGPPPEIANLISQKGIRLEASAPDDVTAAVLLVAVKPQMMGDVLPALRPVVGSETVVVSIAAGTTIATLSVGLGTDNVVRSIPNTPAQVGRGMTVAVATCDVGRAQRAVVTDLLSAVGKVGWVEDEELIDAATGVSGSGPAYVFFLVEALAEAGRAAGLDADLAMTLARQTVTGAGELLHRSDLDAATLRQNVTSPGGTTAAALNVLMAEEGGLAGLMREAVAAATKRSRELAG
ncbi:pyrroline-5-carboxylate reductase [Rhodobium orientis]|uniref:Pyrroline-5-carboxylate reductase n=1 Tax=Rhodobium orientis TaxID=34017 RepID=A0A327JWV9_9HYPH|nr:pyrroline-5-carboxylate reductase [Rhodobium orientis]MBB4301175.1 pyrroline-5-carboxylate reductase [Rhodobium orientis]MBK5949814.1 pyrroline-5-carboxylate reductase [Rhodobium orientis]RAI30054.1 pyrroline-5-carboxylate reductase [Rhodobium orientis]